MHDDGLASEAEQLDHIEILNHFDRTPDRMNDKPVKHVKVMDDIVIGAITFSSMIIPIITL